jgi:hypothetical protein
MKRSLSVLKYCSVLSHHLSKETKEKKQGSNLVGLGALEIIIMGISSIGFVDHFCLLP